MQCAYRQQVFQNKFTRSFALTLSCILLPRLPGMSITLYTILPLFTSHLNGCLITNTYTSQGAGGKPVVLIHGFGLSSFQYRDTLEALSLTNKVYALDLLGFGSSGTLLNVFCLVPTLLEFLIASSDAKTFSS